MLRVTIDSTHVETRPGLSKRTGKPYESHTQIGWIHLVDPTGAVDRFPTKARFSVDDPKQPYPVGEYVFHASQIQVNQWGDPGISFPKLFPARKPVAAAA